MFVSDIMSTCVAECTEDASLEEVFELIQKCDHGLVVVLDSLAHRVPIGVVTEHSICEQVIRRGRNPKNLLAGSVIDPRIRKVVSTDLVEKVGDAKDGDVAAIIVVDEDRQIRGLISKDKMKNLRSSATRSFESAQVAGSASSQSSTTNVSGIPALGWIQ